jgi:tRNA (mo5U34)-methyltransferase
MQEVSQGALDLAELRQRVQELTWYHTLDLENDIITPGIYDHRPYLHYYGIPDDLRGTTVLDVGAASGFFSFEMERRGAQVTAVDLPAWFDHDFGPLYVPDLTIDEGLRYLREPILLARKALGSHIDKIETSVYDLSPETVGMYDLVFCGSLLLHLTDPIRALWHLQSITREQAIIATGINPDARQEPTALFIGQHRGDAWWLPNPACLKAMVQAAGFASQEWVSEFRLDYRDGRTGLFHAVIRAWKTSGTQHPPMSDPVLESGPRPQEASLDLAQVIAERNIEIARLRQQIAGYEQGRFIRFMHWLHKHRKPLRD